MDQDLTPPVLGAELHVCKSGGNIGQRYWAVRGKNNWGQEKLVFFEWIDKPRSGTEVMLSELLERVKRMEEKVDKIYKQC